MNQVQSYIRKRKKEVLSSAVEDTHKIIGHSYKFLEEILNDRFKKVTPSMARKLELLEALLFGFVEHAMNLDMLDQIENHLQSIQSSIVEEENIQ